MRIVITNNGTSEICSLSAPKQIEKTQSRTPSPVKRKPSKKKKPSLNESQLSENLPQDLSTVKNIKITQKKLSLPSDMADKYSEVKNKGVYYSNDSYEQSSQLLPDVLVSIEKSIDNGLNSSSTKLPTIRPSYPIKYIISPKAMKKIKQEVNDKNRRLLIKSKLTTNNHFRTEVRKNPHKIFELNSNKEIKVQNRNLIEYLNTDSTISDQYLSKLAKYDEERLSKLNKICQKAFHYREQEGIIRNIIHQKIKGELNSESEYCKNKLKEMKSDLDQYNQIVETDYPKYDKKDRYTFQYREAEKNWSRFNTQRFYKKSSPPNINFQYS